jgi:hypothetical protein
MRAGSSSCKPDCGNAQYGRRRLARYHAQGLPYARHGKGAVNLGCEQGAECHGLEQ